MLWRYFFWIVAGLVWWWVFALIPLNNKAQVPGKAARSQTQQSGSRNISEFEQWKTPPQQEG